MTGKSKKILIATSLIGAMIIAGTAIVISRRKRKDLERKLLLGNTDVIDQAKETDSAVVFPLQNGAGYSNTPENNAVKLVQRYLNMKIKETSYIGLSLLDEDGKFGSQTQSALFRIAGVSTVSYSLYKTMQTALIPQYLNPDSSAYTEPKASIFDNLLKF
jgi:hypothetical protein